MTLDPAAVPETLVYVNAGTIFFLIKKDTFDVSSEALRRAYLSRIFTLVEYFQFCQVGIPLSPNGQEKVTTFP